MNSKSKKYFFCNPLLKESGREKTQSKLRANMPTTRSAIKQSKQKCILDKDAVEASKSPRKRGSCSETARSLGNRKHSWAENWKLIEPGHYTSLTVARKNAKLIRMISRCVSAEQNNKHAEIRANIQQCAQ